MKTSSAMRYLPFLIVAVALVADAGMPGQKISYDSFRMVRTRNIFDPDRRAMVTYDANHPAPATANSAAASAPLRPSDYVALNGVLVTEDSAFAFFTGSRSEYNKVLPVKSLIAGASIVEIKPDSIVVQRDGKNISVAVGQTVPLDVSAAPVAAPATAAPVNTVPSSMKTAFPAAPPVDASEQMRRMMERRQKELQ